MKHDDIPPPFDWEKLATAAQRAPRQEPPDAPYGLATRVLALAREQSRAESMWFSWCLRAAAVSLVLALIAHFASPAANATDLAALEIESQISALVFAP